MDREQQKSAQFAGHDITKKMFLSRETDLKIKKNLTMCQTL